MTVKLTYLLLLGASLIIGYLVGRAVAKHSASKFPGAFLFLTGAVIFFIGQVEADDDHRFRLLAIGGLCLQVAGMVGSWRRHRTLKERSVDLWAPQK